VIRFTVSYRSPGWWRSALAAPYACAMSAEPFHLEEGLIAIVTDLADRAAVADKRMKLAVERFEAIDEQLEDMTSEIADMAAELNELRRKLKKLAKTKKGKAS
jgi:ActR/RegA family two-component response regulator